MYAVIQLGYAIFGTGQTEAEALADARQWVDNPATLDTDIVPVAQAMDGDLVCIECTQKLHDLVQEHGGDVVYEIRDKIAHIVDS